MSKRSSLEKAQKAYAKVAGPDLERHIFLCSVSDKQKCCSREEGTAAWNFLKRRLKELGLAGPKRGDGTGGVQRTKADCLQICAMGPVAVVWPDNVWYHSMDEEALETVIQEHLIEGKPVERFRLKNPEDT
ncbi:(2Fe-2S) ferredoxin domain-containing protein [Qipengyuania sp. JC766]|uniref:(2Fe-2S) ferredoxin domain-containing protein n=1 Tax=Qipengyuania sp. JC766 TaxID=3232139 RepID=UPI003457D02F